MERENDDNGSFQVEFSEYEFDEKKNKNSVHFFKLFRFADSADICMVIFGIFGSLVVGVSFPLNLLIFANVVNEFTTGDALGSMQRNLKWYMILGAGTFLIALIQMFCFSLSAKRQGRRIRLLLFKKILRQDVAWYDKQSLGDIITKLTANVDQIESGIGDRLGRFVQYFVMFVSCFANAFTNQWKLALVGLSTTPVIVFAFCLMGIALRKFSMMENEAYSSANSIASEVLTSIRTVFAFVGQEKERDRYESKLGSASRVSVKKNLILGIGIGLIGFSIYGSAGLTFWYGIKLLEDGENINAGSVTSIVLSFLVGSISLGLVLPEISYFAGAKSAAAGTFAIIDRIPDIDKDESGIVPEKLGGKIEFKNVSFNYPTRPDVTALKNFSLNISPGQTIAIVGPSGSGKSTSVQLIQRFYDANEGKILIDDIPIQDLDLKWLRSQIGVVSQEPVLFSGTVRENIALGSEGASVHEIESAAKMADAHDFIVALPQAYDTPIAEGGGGMSGGQKQRIAIARAILRNPRILLLDEATSALDTRSERAVQLALDRARTGRTVIMIAHRLTTVRDADKILVVDRGEVKEMGTHEELVSLRGMYANMLTTQSKVKNEERMHSDSETEHETDNDISSFTKDELRQRNVWLRSKSWKEKESEISSLSAASSIVEVIEKHPILRAVKMNKPEFPLFFLGLFIAFIGGLAQPGFSLLYSQMFQIFSIPPNDPTKMENTAFIAGMMALLGLMRLVTQILGSLFLGFAGARLTKRTRAIMFRSILNQEIGWFDKIENQPGILTARLATEVSSLETVTGAQLGSVLEAISLVISSLVIAFMYSWELSLVNLCFTPVILIASSLQMRQLKASIGTHEILGSQVVQEALSAERTVFSFGLEDHFYEKFRKKSAPHADARYKESMMYALVHSVASSITYFQTAASFYTGAVLMNNGTLDLLAVFRTYAAFNFGAQALSRVAAIAPDYKKAIVQIKTVFQTIDRQTKLDATVGDYPDKPFCGKIEFRNVYFRYPTRKNVRILKRFNHTVNPGESIALVGSSGCGKSTLLQLVQRLYEVNNHGDDSGIFIDDRNIRDLAPNWIRQQIGIVSQEPNLFDLTIRENIAYGNNTREVTMDEIIAAAKDANAHEFIINLPEDYDTKVGARGSQLSGGQKQRVAIARALIRKPRLLLLDEATSALDNESERIVQTALERAMKDGSRTSLVVAHRLTTVENCDTIVVLQEGSKVESGPPAELMNAKGVYYTLHNVDSAVKPR